MAKIGVSMVDGHIDGADTCVMCGRDIPEGKQVCGKCEGEHEGKR